MRWPVGAGYRHRYFWLDPDLLHAIPLFLVFQLAAVARLAVEAYPAHYTAFIVLVAAIWLACLGMWTWHSASIYLAPRQDGMPG